VLVLAHHDDFLLSKLPIGPFRPAAGSESRSQRRNPQWHALLDDRNRMLVAVNYNTDIGDAWEFADVPYYPEQMTALAYRYGINYIIYAMTH